MITGDYHHTGIAVCRDVGMLKPQGKVLVIDTIPAVSSQSRLFATKLQPGLSSKCTASSIMHHRSTAAVKRSVSFASRLNDPGCDLEDHDQDHGQDDQRVGLITTAAERRGADLLGQADSFEIESDILQQQQSVLPQPSTIARMKSLPWGSGSIPVELSNVQDGCNQSVQHVKPQLSTIARMRSTLFGASTQAAAAEEEEGRNGAGRHKRVRLPLAVAIPPAAPEHPLEGLRFLINGQETLEPSEALTALAEGQMQCAVTGDALEHLLQHHDLSVLETIMRSVVVFSRMQPHQKGQVMDLLGMQGIHQLFSGRTRYIPVRAKRVTCLYASYM